MTLAHPAALLLLALLLFLPGLLRRSRGALPARRRQLLGACQALAFALLVLALANPLLPRASLPGAQVVVIAHSAGLDAETWSQLQDEVRSLRAAQDKLRPFHVVLPTGPLPPGTTELPADPPGPATCNFAHLLETASNLLPAAEGGEIHLFSDGSDQGVGRSDLELEARGISLQVTSLPGPARGPQLLAVEHPGQVQVGAATEVLLWCEARVATQQECALEQAGRVLTTQTVRLRPGKQALSLTLRPQAPGLQEFQARLGSGPQAQTWRCAVLVEGQLQVTHLGPADRRAALRSALAPLGIQIQDQGSADVVLVDDHPAAAWTDAEQRQLRSAVLDQGVGLLLSGSRQNLGPGGYARSPLADILPVEMPQREERRDPSTSLVLIIDTSGSMSGVRVELAKEVARLALRRLLPHDKVGIVEFYGSKRWAAPLQPAANTIELQRALNRLNAGGGTVIYSAIEEAYYALLNARTRFKHVLVLTDGGVESGPFEALTRRMADAGQTVSTVLIGPQGNSPFLMNLAQWGRGRFYACPSRFQLPELRFKEPQSSPLPATQQGRLQLERVGLHEASAAFESGSGAPVRALVEARPREGASLLLRAGPDRPLLASWDQGAGRVATLSTDLLGPGAEALSQTPEHLAFAADLLRKLAAGRRGPELRTRPVGSWMEVRLDAALDPGAQPVLRLGEGTEIGMSPQGEGSFVSRLPWPEGNAAFRLSAHLGTEQISVAGAVHPGAAALLRSGRATLPSPTETPPAPPGGLLSARRACLAAAGLLFLLSLLIRRWP